MMFFADKFIYWKDSSTCMAVGSEAGSPRSGPARGGGWRAGATPSGRPRGDAAGAQGMLSQEAHIICRLRRRDGRVGLDHRRAPPSLPRTGVGEISKAGVGISGTCDAGQPASNSATWTACLVMNEKWSPGTLCTVACATR